MHHRKLMIAILLSNTFERWEFLNGEKQGEKERSCKERRGQTGLSDSCNHHVCRNSGIIALVFIKLKEKKILLRGKICLEAI